MSGRHDRSTDGEQSANVLLTGPIVIRGLGRGMKDALLPGRPSRHRAFVDDAIDDAAPVDQPQLRRVLEDGPSVAEPGPSSPLPDGPAHAAAGVQVAGEPPMDDADEQRQPAAGSAPTPWWERAPDDVEWVEQPRQPADEAPADAEPGSDAEDGSEDEVLPDTTIEPEPEPEGDEPAEVAEPPAPPADAPTEDGPADRATDAVAPVPLSAQADVFAALFELREANRAREQARITAALPVLDATTDPVDDEADELEDDGPRSNVEPEPEPEPEREPEPEPEPEREPEPEPDDDADEGSGDEGDEAGEGWDEEGLKTLTGDDGVEGLGIEDAEHRIEVIGEVETDAAPAPDEPRAEHAVPAHDPGEEPADDPVRPVVPFFQLDDSFAVTTPEDRGVAVPFDASSAAVLAPADDREVHDPAPAEQEWTPQPERDVEPEQQEAEPERAVAESEPEQSFAESEAEPQPEPEDASPDAEPQPAPVHEDGELERDIEPDEEPGPVRDVEPEPAGLEPEPVPVRDAAPEQEDPEPRPVLDAQPARDPDDHEPAVAEGGTTPVPALGRGAVGSPPSRPAPPPPRRRPPRGARERIGREGIGIAVLVVLALVCAALITAVVLKTRDDAAIAAAEAAAYTPPALPTPEPAATGPSVVVIGDGTTTQAASGVAAAQRWTGVLEAALGGTVTTDAAAGMGYAAKSDAGVTFVTAAAKVPADTDVVVFFGGAADEDVATLSVARAATQAYAAAKQQAPDAEIVVIGPAISGGVGTATLTSLRATLKSSAAIAKATWIDPMREGWLPASAQQADSATDLTAADERTLATKVQAVVQKAIG
ncbi:hypothetical protein [uncultured Amnibacterium sp.]|uniref:hypothetical protein n=1 Tax=uncultured Amnibacterium sp. TaxID=1631851 RepID=UPI0035C9F2D3